MKHFIFLINANYIDINLWQC